jgi:hypothetical protein
MCGECGKQKDYKCLWNFNRSASREELQLNGTTRFTFIEFRYNFLYHLSRKMQTRKIFYFVYYLIKDAVNISHYIVSNHAMTMSWK